ncbi:hypothetical protein BDN67DRAFT_1016741 [Paxillus ammoniavirescens]|nr:hypothetical protein BDN67DRAFT_1016741 [Paxillus ammoniavirescens]
MTTNSNNFMPPAQTWYDALNSPGDRDYTITPSSNSVPIFASPVLLTLHTLHPADISEIVGLLLTNNDGPSNSSLSSMLQVSHSPAQPLPQSLIAQWMESPSHRPLTIRPVQLSLIPAFYSDPVQPDPVQRDPVQPDPVQRDPVQCDPIQCDPIQHDPATTQTGSHNCILNASGTHPSLLVKELQKQGAPTWSVIVSEVSHFIHHYLFTSRLGRDLSVTACTLILHDALSWVSMCNPEAHPKTCDLTLQFQTIERNMKFLYQKQDVGTGWDVAKNKEKLFLEGLCSDYPQCMKKWFGNKKLFNAVTKAIYDPDNAAFLELTDTEDSSAIPTRIPLCNIYQYQRRIAAVLIRFIVVTLKDRSETKKAPNQRVGELTTTKQANAHAIANQLEDFFDDVNKGVKGTLTEEQSADRKVNLIHVLSRPEWLPHSATLLVAGSSPTSPTPSSPAPSSPTPSSPTPSSPTLSSFTPSSPTPSSPASSMSSLSVSIPASEQRDTCVDHIRRDRTHKVVAGRSYSKLCSLPQNHPRRRSKLWFDALMRKQDLIKRLFEEQCLIEEVEHEASLHLLKDAIAHFRALHAAPQDLSSPLS